MLFDSSADTVGEMDEMVVELLDRLPVNATAPLGVAVIVSVADPLALADIVIVFAIGLMDAMVVPPPIEVPERVILAPKLLFDISVVTGGEMPVIVAELAEIVPVNVTMAFGFIGPSSLKQPAAWISNSTVPV